MKSLEVFDRAGKRADWAARALSAAADELRAVGEQGAVVNGTAAQVQAEAERVARLVGLIAADRDLAGSARRVRDGL